jgi:murein DD-endopeptidase MepM/ murein hydrolase activator NlpD
LRYKSRIRRLGQNWGRLIASGKHRCFLLAKKIMPYLNVRYWGIYLLAFGLGFYLFGPAHGWRQVSQLNPWRRRMTAPTPQTMVALQRELQTIKKDLRQLTAEQRNTALFTPEQFRPPANGTLIQGYQWISSRHIWRLHPGVDFQMAWGSPVLAAAAGRVISCERTASGFSIKLDHGNAWESVYAELAEARVRMGQKVRTGQTIGTSGIVRCIQPEQAGFHFGLYHRQKPVDPGKIISGL